MQTDKTLTHYERIGGADQVRALVHNFYQIMDELPESYGIRKMHAEDLKNPRTRTLRVL